VTSVGENEEKANTIQPPLLVFFSPSKQTYIKMKKMAERGRRHTHTHIYRERYR